MITGKKKYTHDLLSVIVIGLNEEANLGAALTAVFAARPQHLKLEVFYVDSGSKDKSVEIARSFGQVQVIHLGDASPSAAKARNAGLRKASGAFVQLLDGDSLIQPGFVEAALATMAANLDIACVVGHCVEMFPEASIYMRTCGLDWHLASGDCRYSGGNAMWRRKIFEEVGLFDETLRYGEEPDLCYRVRQQRGRIVCIDMPMVRHDLGMHTFSQYWKRSEHLGRGYARVAMRYWSRQEKLWLYEAFRNFAEPLSWLFILFIGTLAGGGLLTGCAALVCWWMARGLSTALKVRPRSRRFLDACIYGLHSQFVRLPTAIGQIRTLLAMSRARLENQK